MKYYDSMNSAVLVQRALGASQAWVWACDAKGRLTYTNFPEKLPSRDDNSLETLLQVVAPVDRERRARELRCALVDRTGRRMEFLALHPSDNEVAICEEIDIVRQDGEFQGLIGIGVAVAASNVSSESATEEVELQVGALNHEVRNFLVGIRGSLELVQDSPLTPGQRQLLLACEESCETVLQLMQASLDLSRLETGLVSATREVFSPEQNVRQVLALLKKTAKEHRGRLRFHKADDAPAWVEGDPHGLRLVLSNLVTNPLKYSQGGGVEVALKGEQPAGGLRIEVNDRGPGISSDFQNVMYLPYMRRETEASAGTGLGLGICQRLVKAMGGGIDCESTARGTTFSVSLPFRTEAAPRRRTSSAPNVSHFNGMRVLVVEDQPVVQKVLVQQLRKMGAHCAAVSHGGEALQLLDAVPVELILLDLHLPGVDGCEIARQVRRRLGDDVLIVGLTGEARRGVRRRCMEAGMDECFTKPLPWETLSGFLDKRLLTGMT